MKPYVSVIFALHLVSMNLLAWTDGELLVMDSDRGYALAPAAEKFETEFGLCYNFVVEAKVGLYDRKFTSLQRTDRE